MTQLAYKFDGISTKTKCYSKRQVRSTQPFTTLSGAKRREELDFFNIYKCWKNAVEFISDPVEKFENPYFKLLVDRVDVYKPFILKQLKRNSSMLVMVLHYSNSERPYDSSLEGNLTAMTDAWLYSHS